MARRVAFKRRAFTLLELLVAIAIIAVLVSLGFAAFAKAQMAARKAASTHNLQQFAAATAMYLGEHENTFFPYRLAHPDGSITWWFGNETAASLRSGEGHRSVDKTQSPLYPYLQQDGGVEVDPGLIADPNALKPKYENASYGYGYNVLLGGGWMGAGRLTRVSDLATPSNTIIFATCAQVNTFQAPASGAHPMVEAFYGLDDQDKTIHFRFFSEALVLFEDGHVQSMSIYPGTSDNRMPGYVIGRVTPVGSLDMLR